MLDIEVTRRCNLRCDYCFVGWSRDWTSDMPELTAHRIVREGAGLFRQLHFTGGEPFAYKPLLDLCEASLKLGYEEVLINTNATMLTDASISRMQAMGPKLRLTISLDGPRHLHDAARGEGTFDEAGRGLASLLSKGIRACVMCVVTPSVLEVLPEFLTELAETYPRFEGVTLFPVGVGPEGSQKPGVLLRPLTPAELSRLAMITAIKYRMGYPVNVAAYPIINPLLLAFGYPREQLYQCSAGRGRVCVHADLSVSTCHPVKEPVYGQYRPGLFKEIAGMEAHARMKHRDFEGCRECGHQEICGHCRAFVRSSGEDLYGNDRICYEVLGEESPAPRKAQKRRLQLVPP